MSPGKRRLLIGSGIAAGALVAGAGLALYRRSSTRPGDSLRRMRFVDLKGEARTLEEWSGSVVLVNFWATWCAPCVEEIPMLGELRRAHRSKGFEVVGIAIDQARKVGEMAAKLSIEYPILLAEAEVLQVLRELGNASGGLPYTVLLDRSLRPAARKLGALKRPEAEALVAQAIGG